MSDILSKPVPLTGASGDIGGFLARTLAAAGWTMRPSDLAPFPGPLPGRATFRRVDLAQGIDVMRLAGGCGLVLHLGGASHDPWPFEDVLNANLRGIYHVCEAARRAGARVVFASSSHVVGFPEPSTARMLSSWRSTEDLGRMMLKRGEAETVGHEILWGASDDPRPFRGADDRDAIGRAPVDGAGRFAEQIAGAVTGDPVVEKYRGGTDTRRPA